MTSRISFSNILKEDLRRRVWMLALSCLASFITLPVTFLLANRSYLERIRHAASAGLKLQEYYVDFFHFYGALFQAFVLGVGAIIVSVWGFRHLYSRKMVDLYHSIPVRRERLFFASYLNSLLIWLVPMLTGTAATLLIAFANMTVHGSITDFGPVLVSALKLISVSIASFLTVFHFCLVCVMLSGNVVNALFQIAVFGCGAWLLYSVYTLFCSTFLHTYVQRIHSMDFLLWTAPMIGPFCLMADFADSGAAALFWDISASSLESGGIFRVLSLCLTIFNLLLAVHLYKKRPSELAEHGIDHKCIQTLMRFCTGILCGLFGAVIFLWLVDRDAFAWQIFGILFCGTLAFGVTDIIMHMNFKAFFQHKLQMCLCLILSCLALTVFFFDLTGFDHRLPGKEQIISASLTLSHYDDDSSGFTFQDDTIVSVDYNNYVEFTDLNSLYALLEAVSDSGRTNTSGVGNISVRLQTPMGPFYRRYRIQSEDLELLRPIVESQEYIEAFYPASLGLLPSPKELNVISSLKYSQYTTESTAEIQDIMQAYKEDFQANTTLERLNTGRSVGYLEFPYAYTPSGSTTLQSYHFSLPLYAHYTQTIAKIREYYPDLAFAMEDLTITSLEIYPAEIEFFTLFDLDEDALVETTDDFWMEPITINDPQELEDLLPLLTVGDYHSAMFPSTNQHHYLGAAHVNSGETISLFVPASALPLPATETVREAAEQLGEDPM